MLLYSIQKRIEFFKFNCYAVPLLNSKVFLFKFVTLLPICAQFHMEFHTKYGRITRIDDFIDYINFLDNEQNRGLDKTQLSQLKLYLLTIKPVLYSLL